MKRIREVLPWLLLALVAWALLDISRRTQPSFPGEELLGPVVTDDGPE